MSIIKNKKNLAILITLVLVGIAAFYILSRDDVKQAADNASKTTSQEASAQSDFADGNNDNKDTAGNTIKENNGSANIRDTQGSADSSNQNPISSSSGQITVYAPESNQVIKSGQLISGTSTLPSVDYRIIDNLTGVIATGKLDIVDGKFSGTISYNSNATEGRIDIYSMRSDGTEFSNIEIPVRFK